MKFISYFSDGLKIFKLPVFVLAYACYTVFVALIVEYMPLSQIIIFIFINPLILSYCASLYFIEAVDPVRSSDHRILRFKFYIPFMVIFALFFLVIVIQSAIIGFLHQQNNTPMSTLVLYSFLSSTIDFWMVAIMFSCGNVWQGFLRAFRLARDNSIAYGLLFFAYFSFEVCHTYFKIGQWDPKAPTTFILLHIVNALIDLYAIRVIVAFAAHSAQERELKSILDSCITGRSKAQAQVAPAKQMANANVCLLLGALSIVPVIHLFAMIQGWKRFTRQQQGKFRAMVGFALGVFFTVFYCLALLGNIAANSKKNVVLPHISTLDSYMSDNALSKELKQILRQIRGGDIGFDPRVLAQQLESMRSDQAPERYFALGLAHEYALSPQQALAAFKKYLELGGSSDEALFHIARINLFQLNDYFEARNGLVRFLTVHPNDKTAKLYISLIDNRVAWNNNWIISILSVIALLIALTSHEFGHSFTAYKCGDTTSKEAGRMSLNPIVHLDLFGSIILPAFLILSRSSVIVGWAKPVPVNRENFKNPKRDSVLVALMGCLTNFSIALVSTVVLTFMTVIMVITVPHFVTIHWLFPADFISVAGLPFAKFWIYFAIFLILMIMINIGIGIFNLIPIPPLDGSWILERRLAPFLKEKFAAYQQFSFLIILILLFTNVIDIIIRFVLSVFFAFVQVLVPVLHLM
jgi:Zn-dependent protease